MEIKLDIWEMIERENRARAYSRECALRRSRKMETETCCIAIGLMVIVILQLL